jgi:allophanate hydrolase subunit 2
VISADIPIAAQLRPGAKIHFKQVTVFEAQAILHRLARKMEESLC